MRARLRMLRACTLLAAMTVVSHASADETPATTPTRSPIVRFDDETPEPHSVARIYEPTDARTEPNQGGELIARLPRDKYVTRIASRGDALLVAFDDPDDSSARVTGWVPRACTLTRDEVQAAARQENEAIVRGQAAPGLADARATRTTGIVLFSAGLGLGAFSSLFGLMAMGFGGGDKGVPFLFAGGVLGGFGLGVGLPMWVVGQVQMNRIRARRALTLLPQLSVSIGDHAGGLAAAWRW